jgi:hypothetical protein
LPGVPALVGAEFSVRNAEGWAVGHGTVVGRTGWPLLNTRVGPAAVFRLWRIR